MYLNRLSTCHRKDPVGIGSDVYFSWILESTQPDTYQRAWQLRIECDGECVYDSGKRESAQQSFMPCEMRLVAGKQYEWFVTVWDNHGNTATEGATFETADRLRRLRDEGVTVVTALHDLPLALSLADHVAVMENGTVVFEGTPALAVESGVLSRTFAVRVARLAEGYTVSPL